MEKCEVCGKECKNKTALALHRRTHEKKPKQSASDSQDIHREVRGGNGKNNDAADSATDGSSDELNKKDIGLEDEEQEKPLGSCSDCGADVYKKDVENGECPNCKSRFD
jgi:hypothetical protein